LANITTPDCPLQEKSITAVKEQLEVIGIQVRDDPNKLDQLDKVDGIEHQAVVSRLHDLVYLRINPLVELLFSCSSSSSWIANITTRANARRIHFASNWSDHRLGECR
jgi:hypothetical protein